MEFSRLEIAPGLVADARRALWLAEERVLVVTDLHLGYAWAHRHHGQLLPLSAGDDARERLAALQQDYQPREIVLLGDIVHRPVPVPALADELRRLVECLAPASALTFVRGNHDVGLEELLARILPGAELAAEVRRGGHLLIHGDASPQSAPPGRTIMGHEHPVLILGDGVATAAKTPCFLVSDRVLVLPAFSAWAAGCPVGRDRFLSPLLNAAEFPQAVAIVGSRLLRLPL